MTKEEKILDALRNILAFSTGQSNGSEQARLKDIQLVAREAIATLTVKKADKEFVPDFLTNIWRDNANPR